MTDKPMPQIKLHMETKDDVLHITFKGGGVDIDAALDRTSTNYLAQAWTTVAPMLLQFIPQLRGGVSSAEVEHFTHIGVWIPNLVVLANHTAVPSGADIGAALGIALEAHTFFIDRDGVQGILGDPGDLAEALSTRLSYALGLDCVVELGADAEALSVGEGANDFAFSVADLRKMGASVPQGDPDA